MTMRAPVLSRPFQRPFARCSYSLAKAKEGRSNTPQLAPGLRRLKAPALTQTLLQALANNGLTRRQHPCLNSGATCCSAITTS